MEYTTLGRTGLDVSVAGLGCGGHSRLGQSSGASFTQSTAVVEAALDLGITFIDTAAAYGTEEIVARALRGKREGVVLSTKGHVVKPDTSPLGDDFVSAKGLRERCEASLKRLEVETIDIYHLHGVMAHQYPHCVDVLLPELIDLRAEGKIRFFGLTERFVFDTSHDMLARALRDEFWDVVMVGYNLVNQSAARSVLPMAVQSGAGVLAMFAVRRMLSDAQALRSVIGELAARGEIDCGSLDRGRPLGFLQSEGGAESLVDGAYRYCRHSPGVDVVLTGTGKIAHLRDNVASILRGPLAGPCLDKLAAIFGSVDSVSGE